jgi:hypothetical protein
MLASVIHLQTTTKSLSSPAGRLGVHWNTLTRRNAVVITAKPATGVAANFFAQGLAARS